MNRVAPQTHRLALGNRREETEYQSYLAKRALELMRAEFREDIWQACWKQTAEGQTASEVANELPMTLNTAYLAKSRVLHRLREELAGLLDESGEFFSFSDKLSRGPRSPLKRKFHREAPA